MWVDLNTEKVGEIFGEWNKGDVSFCEGCQSSGTVEEVPDPCKSCDGLGLMFIPSYGSDGLPDGDEPHFANPPDYKPPTIERCDTCRQYKNDDEAMKAVRKIMLSLDQG